MENNVEKYLDVFKEYWQETERILQVSQNKIKEQFTKMYKVGIFEEVNNKDEVYELLVQYANGIDKCLSTGFVYIKNIDVLVRSVGCYYCTIELLKKLRREGIYVVFIEEEMCTLGTDYDLLIGAKLAEKSIVFQDELFASIE